MTKPLFNSIQFKSQDFEVCWAGANPFEPGFCFGSENGAILLTDEDGKALRAFRTGSISQEAVNGVAGLGSSLAVSTRREITFWTIPQNDGEKVLVAQFQSGAHGVLLSAKGFFVAPLGRTGIMAAWASFQQGDAERPVTVIRGDLPGLYIYKVISLEGVQGRELLVCAGRHGGVCATEFQWEQNTTNMSALSFDNLDVVDVCAIGQPGTSRAVAAIGKDGTLILMRDVLQDQKPLTLKYEVVTGVAYRLFSCRGDLFLLTSDGLYVLVRLAESFLNGTFPGNVTTPVLPLAMEAVDANLYLDKWLLVVMPDEARMYDVRLIHENAPDNISNGEFQERQAKVVIPNWKQRSIIQELSAVG